jgi:Na+/proline symporter
VLYPHLEHPESGYMLIVSHHVPPALRGVVVAGFMAAFMSTYATQLNWGASYLVADFYRRFLKTSASEEHYVGMSRLATVLLVVVSAIVSMQLSSIRSGWEFVLEAGAGTGGVYLLRWYWWRINAWSEISAMVTALVVSLALRLLAPFSGTSPVLFAKTAVATTAITTLVWVVVTLLTSPEPETRLVEFYRKVRPDVRGWRPVARIAPDVPPTADLGRNLLAWLLGCAMVYLALFAVGRLVLGAHRQGLILLLLSGMCALALRANLKGSWREDPAEAE